MQRTKSIYGKTVILSLIYMFIKTLINQRTTIATLKEFISNQQSENFHEQNQIPSLQRQSAGCCCILMQFIGKQIILFVILMWGNSELLKERKKKFEELAIQGDYLSKNYHYYGSKEMLISEEFSKENEILHFLVDPLLNYTGPQSEIVSLGVEKMVEKYFSQPYIQTHEQNFATLALCNMYYIVSLSQPSGNLTQDIFTLVKKGSKATINNCLGIIQNVGFDHPQWMQQAIIKHDLCKILCDQFQKKCLQDGYDLNLINELRLMTIIVAKSPPRDEYKKFLPKLMHVIAKQKSKNPSFQTQYWEKIIVSQAIACLYYFSLIFPSHIQAFLLEEQKVGQKWSRLSQWFKADPTIIIVILFIFETALRLEKSSLQRAAISQYIKFLAQLAKHDSDLIKQFVFLILVGAIQEKKITAYEVASYEGFLEFLDDHMYRPMHFYLAQIYEGALKDGGKLSFAKRAIKSFENFKKQRKSETELIEKVDKILQNLSESASSHDGEI